MRQMQPTKVLTPPGRSVVLLLGKIRGCRTRRKIESSPFIGHSIQFETVNSDPDDSLAALGHR